MEKAHKIYMYVCNVYIILTVVPPFLPKCCGHECEQREPEWNEHTHIAQTVVTVQLVHQEDLKRNIVHIK